MAGRRSAFYKSLFEIVRDKYVVMGATLKCPHGEKESILLPDASTETYITYNGLTQIPETATKENVNILHFGDCKECGKPCKAEMKTAEKWLGAVPSFTSDGVKVLIETSELHCQSNAAVIEITECGQNQSLEDILAKLDADQQTYVYRYLMERELRGSKDAKMLKLGLTTEEEFEAYIKNALEMIDVWYGDYMKQLAGCFERSGDKWMENGQILTLYYDFLFLSSDAMIAAYTLEERKGILKMLKAGKSDKEIAEKYGGATLSPEQVYEFTQKTGSYENFLQEAFRQDSDRLSRAYDVFGFQLVMNTVLGSQDGSGPPSQDYFDHSGTWRSVWCFVAGTQVITENEYLPIEDIKVGISVLTKNPFTGALTYKRVMQTYVNEADVLFEIYVSGQVIQTTETHPFYVKNHGWVDASQLQEEMLLATASEEYLEVESIKQILLECNTKVYNFEVEDYHTYFVTEMQILVHNDCSSGTKEWSKGSFDTPEESLYYHYEKHGSEVGASSIEQYLNKAQNFSLKLKGARRVELSGATEGVIRYYKNGKYIDMLDDQIFSFGKQ